MKILTFLIIVLLYSFSLKKQIRGSYCACEMHEFITFIKLKRNKTFIYEEHFELGGPIIFKGKWKLIQDTLIIYDSPNNSNISNNKVPNKWLFEDNKLFELKGNNKDGLILSKQ